MEAGLLSEVAERASETATEVRNQVDEAGERIARSASAASQRVSTQFTDYTRKNPPQAALTALAVGAVLGWIAGRLLKD